MLRAQNANCNGCRQLSFSWNVQCMWQALVVLQLLPVLLHNTAGRDVQEPGLDYTLGRLKSLSSLSLAGNGFSGHVCT